MAHELPDVYGDRGVTPLAIDLFCGLSGWGEGLAAEGWRVVGFDLHDMSAELGLPRPTHYQLVIQNALTIHGSQFRNADLIVASPPCQEYSYMAMPWSRAKAIAAEYRAGVRDVKQLTALFDACFRIQREACEAAGRHIPMVVENVRGAQPWVGRSRANVGPYHLWGDVPAILPNGNFRKQEGDPSWFYDNYETSARRFGSKSKERKAWSAKVAKIPFALAQHVARSWKPEIAAAA